MKAAVLATALSALATCSTAFVCPSAALTGVSRCSERRVQTIHMMARAPKAKAVAPPAPVAPAASKAESMKKAEFVAEIAMKSGLTKTQADAAVGAFLETVVETVTDGKKLNLAGFGTFEARDRSARSGRNPQTGEAIEIAATRMPAFSASKTFKDKVKANMK